MKTPKEKAKELFNKYFDMKWQSYSHKKTSIKSMTKSSAKQCAIIAVDEIIDMLSFDLGHDNTARYLCEYLKEVKIEIEKL